MSGCSLAPPRCSVDYVADTPEVRQLLCRVRVSWVVKRNTTDWETHVRLEAGYLKLEINIPITGLGLLGLPYYCVLQCMSVPQPHTGS